MDHSKLVQQGLDGDPQAAYLVKHTLFVPGVEGEIEGVTLRFETLGEVVAYLRNTCRATRFDGDWCEWVYTGRMGCYGLVMQDADGGETIIEAMPNPDYVRIELRVALRTYKQAMAELSARHPQPEPRNVYDPVDPEERRALEREFSHVLEFADGEPLTRTEFEALERHLMESGYDL